jgi:hypothetical protein
MPYVSLHSLLTPSATVTHVTSSSDISKFTYEPRNRVQSVAAIRDWFHTNSCGYFTDVPCLCLTEHTCCTCAQWGFHHLFFGIFLHFSIDRSLFQPRIIRIRTNSSWGAWIMVSQYFRTLGARFCSISDNNKSVRHFCTNKHVLSLYFLSSKFILFIFNKSLWMNFVTRILCYRTSFLTLLNS